MASCMSQCATEIESITLLGCVVQCSIRSWSTAASFVNCINNCTQNQKPSVVFDKQTNLNQSVPIQLLQEPYRNEKHIFYGCFLSIVIILFLFVIVTKNISKKNEVKELFSDFREPLLIMKN